MSTSQKCSKTTPGKVSFYAAVLMSLNVIIGVGIFFLPQAMAHIAGSVSFWGWVLAPLILAPVVWNMITANQLFRGAGGFFAYGSQGLGRFWGFMAAWIYLIGFSSAAATQLNVFLTDVLYKYVVCPDMVQYSSVWIIGIVSCIFLLNLFDVKSISRIQSNLTLLKLTPIFAVIALLLFAVVSGSLNTSLTLIPSTSDILPIVYTLPLTIFGFWGVESTCSIGDQIEGGEKKAARVIAVAFGLSVMLYALFHLGILHLMGVDNLVRYGVSAVPDFLGLEGGTKTTVAALFRGALMINYINAAYGVFLYSAAYVYHLAHEKLLYGSKHLTQKNRFDRPFYALIIEGAIIALLMLCVRDSLAQAALANLGIVGALFLTGVANIAALKRMGDYKRIFFASWGLAACVLLGYFSWMAMGTTMLQRCMSAIPSCFVIVLGVCMYFLQTLFPSSKKITSRVS